jgi:hypothetical protein
MARRPRLKVLSYGPEELVVIRPELWTLTYDSSRAPAGVLGDEIVPRLVREYIPYSFIKSLSLAIDPFWRFKASPVRITPVNRTRSRSRVSVFDKRQIATSRDSVTTSWTFSGANCLGTTAISSLPTSGIVTLGDQPKIVTQSMDTTSRTRPYKSDLGEFEKFEYSVESPSRTTFRTNNAYGINPAVACGGKAQWATSNVKRIWKGSGAAGVVSAASANTLRLADRATLLAEMQKKALGMLPKVLPERRHSTIYRSVIELKDLPRGIAQLRNTISDLRASIAHFDKSAVRWITDLKTNSKNIPKEWLSYNFGWRQIYRDIVELVAAPERITRDINRIIERNGKPTTYRLEQKYALDTVTTPSFTYDAHESEQDVVVATKRVREIKLRMMVNATFDFPTLAVPQLREDLWIRKLGLRPTPTDIYNLIPWTWLFDWFTGLNNYIEAIDAVNTDRSTFNYGFLTGILSSKMTTVRTSRVPSTESYAVSPNPAVVTTTLRGFSHTSVLESRLTIRKDISAAYGAKALLTGSSLTPYQLSILGALLLTRSKLAR